jgi:hypothetical protein
VKTVKIEITLALGDPGENLLKGLVLVKELLSGEEIGGTGLTLLEGPQQRVRVQIRTLPS